MAVFVTRRERRLWLWTGSVVVVLLAGVGLARTLADELRARDLLDSLFVLAFLMIIAGMVAMALRFRPRGLEVGVALGIAAVYLLVLVRMGIPEERTHIIEYGVLALLLHEALREGADHGRGTRLPAVLAVVTAALIGCLDEGLQWFLPTRVFDPVDLGFNALAATLAIGSRLALERARPKGGRRRGRPPA